MVLWVTVGGPGMNAHSYALLSIQPHNGHNRTLNYSLCKINKFQANETDSGEGRQAKWGKCPREKEEVEKEEEDEEEEADEGSYLHLRLDGYWIQGTLFSWLSSRGLEAGLLWQNDSDSCGSLIITFPFIFLWIFFICSLGDLKEIIKKKNLNILITQYFSWTRPFCECSFTEHAAQFKRIMF